MAGKMERNGGRPVFSVKQVSAVRLQVVSKAKTRTIILINNT